MPSRLRAAGLTYRTLPLSSDTPTRSEVSSKNASNCATTCGSVGDANQPSFRTGLCKVSPNPDPGATRILTGLYRFLPCWTDFPSELALTERSLANGKWRTEGPGWEPRRVHR